MQTTQHNRESEGYQRLDHSDYEQIFERPPTFNEKKAFISLFRHKWKQDMKLTSVFERRHKYKIAKGNSVILNLRKQQIEQTLRKSWNFNTV